MDTFHFNKESVDESIIDLNRIVSNDSCKMYGSSPVLQVVANDGYNQTEICNKLKDGAAQNSNYDVYTDDELVQSWHIRNSHRFGPCTVVARPGYVFQDMWYMLKKYTDFKKREHYLSYSSIFFHILLFLSTKVQSTKRMSVVKMDSKILS